MAQEVELFRLEHRANMKMLTITPEKLAALEQARLDSTHEDITPPWEEE